MIEEPGVQLHVMTVLKVEILSISGRLTGTLDSVLQPDLEDLLVMAVTVNGDSIALTAISLTERASLNSLVIGQIFIWNI